MRKVAEAAQRRVQVLEEEGRKQRAVIKVRSIVRCHTVCGGGSPSVH